MDKKVTVTLLANAGLLLQYDGYTILLDALQRSENAPFSPLSPTLWQELLCGKGQFSKVDALLFSHLHPDHFCADMVVQYLQLHSTPVIMMPQDLASAEIKEINTQVGTHLISLANDAPVRYVLTSEISVLAIPTRHLDKLYYSIPHFCYLLSFGEKNLLITADIDYTYETLSMLDEILLDAAFVNPLFFSALRSNRFFKGNLNVEQICVYHIPFPSDDKLNFRASIRADVSRWSRGSHIEVLDRPLQQIAI